MKNILRNFGILALTTFGTAFAGSTSGQQTVTFNMNKIQVLALDTANVNFSWANADWTAGEATNTKATGGGRVTYTTNVASKITASATALPNYITSLTLAYNGGSFNALGSPLSIAAGQATSANLNYLAVANLTTPAAFNTPSVVTVTYTIADQ